MTAFELEVMVGERGREVMLELLQGHMDLRSIREPQLSEVVDADGIGHRRIEKDHERQLNTVFGRLRIRRIAYRALGCANLHPLDAAHGRPLCLRRRTGESEHCAVGDLGAYQPRSSNGHPRRAGFPTPERTSQPPWIVVSTSGFTQDSTTSGRRRPGTEDPGRAWAARTISSTPCR
jgi:hypothetical protein